MHKLEDSTRTQDHTPAVRSNASKVLIPQTHDLTDIRWSNVSAVEKQIHRTINVISLLS